MKTAISLIAFGVLAGCVIAINRRDIDRWFQHDLMDGYTADNLKRIEARITKLEPRVSDLELGVTVFNCSPERKTKPRANGRTKR